MTLSCPRHRQLVINAVMGIVMMAVGCAGPLHPSPVVPTKSPLPYSAQVRLTDLAAYLVEPGATLRTDPRLRNSVTQARAVSFLSAQAGNKSIVDYVTARQTFRRIVAEGPADVAVLLRIFVFIDPGLGFKFRHTYIAEADAVLKDLTNGSSLATYTGLGKAFGVVTRDSGDDDEEPINKSVLGALNDLFGKIESDKQLFP